MGLLAETVLYWQAHVNNIKLIFVETPEQRLKWQEIMKEMIITKTVTSYTIKSWIQKLAYVWYVGL